MSGNLQLLVQEVKMVVLIGSTSAQSPPMMQMIAAIVRLSLAI